MAKLSFTTLILVSHVLLLFNKCTSRSITYTLLFHSSICFTYSIPITPTDDNRYLPSDDPNITNLMVSHYNCEKQHNLRQFNLLNVKQCTEAPSNIQHANILITLDPLECKNLIRHRYGTDNKILNNLNYSKTFTLLEDQFFEEQLERFRTPFTVYQFNKMYRGTFIYMPADKN